MWRAPFACYLQRAVPMIAQTGGQLVGELVPSAFFGSTELPQGGAEPTRMCPIDRGPNHDAGAGTGGPRSGTSILHRLLREHSDTSGFSDTGVPEDEGQYLQTVYAREAASGGPGQFAFNPGEHLTETS